MPDYNDRHDRRARGKRELARMRWGLVPSWWSKPLKELKLATFNARAETVAAAIALLGNYMASSFVTAADGHSGTVITEGPQTANQQPLLTQPHAT